MYPFPGYSNDEAIDLRDVELLEVCGGEESSFTRVSCFIPASRCAKRGSRLVERVPKEVDPE